MTVESISHIDYNAGVSQAYLDSVNLFQGNFTQAAINDLAQEISQYVNSNDKLFFTDITAYSRQMITEKMNDSELDESIKQGYAKLKNTTIASSLAWMAMAGMLSPSEIPEAPQYLAPGR
ncbi:MAG: hypothetical protein GOU99_01110 [Candidatus Altiarchaeota archaeon]|nr:hypothetical protein [Candidatus Altiarchaeota archaeon]